MHQRFKGSRYPENDKFYTLETKAWVLKKLDPLALKISCHLETYKTKNMGTYSPGPGIVHSPLWAFLVFSQNQGHHQVQEAFFQYSLLSILSENLLNGCYRNALMHMDGPCTEGTYTHWFVLPRDSDPCGKGHDGLKWHKLPACGNAVHS